MSKLLHLCLAVLFTALFSTTTHAQTTPDLLLSNLFQVAVNSSLHMNDPGQISSAVFMGEEGMQRIQYDDLFMVTTNEHKRTLYYKLEVARIIIVWCKNGDDIACCRISDTSGRNVYARVGHSDWEIMQGENMPAEELQNALKLLIE